MMPGQAPNAYLAERDGNIQHIFDSFAAQRNYIEAYISAISPFSADGEWLSSSYIDWIPS